MNYYGLGHGSGNSFMGSPESAYARWIQHRYRFVFIDGCDVANGDLLSVFGADLYELRASSWLPDSFYDVNDPANIRKLRPAVFLSWWSQVPIGYQIPGEAVDDPTTGIPCHFRHFETLCNWHNQLIAWWAQGNTIDDSITYANSVAESWLVSNLSTPGPHYGWVFKVKLPTTGGTYEQTFQPWVFLKKSGYRGLKFSGPESYNSYFDWPHRQ